MEKHAGRVTHLAPLSMYSRMTMCQKQADLRHPKKCCDPFINFKIEVVNSCVPKRKLDDSSRGHSHETPAKRPFSPKALSPDHGCFMDFLSPLLSKVSSSSGSQSSSLLKIEIDNEIACAEHAERQPSAEDGEETVPCGRQCEVAWKPPPAFDCDVDDILCLDPSGVGEDDGLYEQDDEDKGYFSVSRLGHCESRDAQRPPASSSPLLRIVKGEDPGDERHPGSSPEPGCQARTANGQDASFSVSGWCPSAGGPTPDTKASPAAPVEGDGEEEVWNIGPPMFESSLCHSVTLNRGGERRGLVSEEVWGGVAESPSDGQATPITDDITPDLSYETTLSHKVQVKSVITVPHQRSCSSKEEAASPPSDRKTEPSPSAGRVPRTVSCHFKSQRLPVLGAARDLEHRKRLYIQSVVTHTNRTSGLMNELLSLMVHVADQHAADQRAAAQQWQHPSDLTCRNYQRRFRNVTPSVSLRDWQAKNSTTHRRFSKDLESD